MSIILFAVLPVLVHEAGHYVVALFYGKQLKFKFSWGKYHIPRWIWQRPQGVTPSQLRAICQAGFVAELMLMPVMPWAYKLVALIHFIAYPWYAGKISDLEGMV